MNHRVSAVVVTHNRIDLLRECLQALRSQTRRPDHVLVIDNASSDGTSEMLSLEFPEVEVLVLPRNRGGAGGFHEGLKYAYKKGFDWFWLMDDDTVPEIDALAALCDNPVFSDPSVGMLCSHVEWVDGRPHLMNIPQIRPLYRYGARPVAFSERIREGALLVEVCSFVSCLVHRRALEAVGLPYAEFFIYGDDVEFALRVSRQFRCYYVPGSRVVHKTRLNKGVTIDDMPKEHMERLYYDVRNRTFTFRKRGLLWFARYTATRWLGDLWKAIRRGSLRLVAILVVAYIAGCVFRPRLVYPQESEPHSSGSRDRG